MSLLAAGISFGQPASLTLRSIDQNHFLIGAALNRSQVNGENPMAADIAARQFFSITAKNDMKWERIHPEPGRYDFKNADAFSSIGKHHPGDVLGPG